MTSSVYNCKANDNHIHPVLNKDGVLDELHFELGNTGDKVVIGYEDLFYALLSYGFIIAKASPRKVNEIFGG